MKESEIVARINRIERHLGLADIPGVSINDAREYRNKSGCSLEQAKDVVIKHAIARLFIEEMTNP